MAPDEAVCAVSIGIGLLAALHVHDRHRTRSGGIPGSFSIPRCFDCPICELLTCYVCVQVKCMCFDDDDWLEGSPQPTSEAVLRQRREREMRKQLAATQAKGKVGEVEAELVKKATENAETPNPAAKKNTEEKKKD